MDRRKQIETQLRGLFSSARNARFSAPDFLETRVLARLDEAGPQRAVFFWKRLALGSSCLSLLALFALGFFLTRPRVFNLSVNEPFTVRVELAKLKSMPIAKARIVLPEGVFFYELWYPELGKERELTLHWKAISSLDVFPFALSATSRGRKEIRVSFLDERGRVVSERVFHINLKET